MVQLSKKGIGSATSLSNLWPQIIRAILTPLLLTALPALTTAQSVTPGTDLATLPAPGPATIWTLEGSASLSSPLALPAGTPGLTIDGQSGSVITLNDGGGSYGYFNAAASSTINLSGVTITGGIQGSGGTMHGAAGLTVNGNGSVAFTGNTATAYGGALYANGDIHAANVTFDGNTAQIYGGTIFSDTGNITLTNVTLSNNTTTDPTSGYGHGGAVMAFTGNVTLDNVTLTGNAASGIGGGVFAQGNIYANNLTATGNVAAGSNGSVAYGGALLAYTGDAIVTGTSTMTGNSAAYGGAIAAQAASVVMSGRGDISNNSTSGHGGALFATQDISVTADAGDIDINRNTAGTNGGALNATGGVTLTAAAGHLSLSDNTAGQNGGAIRAFNGDVSVNATGGDVIFSGNRASGAGGAIRLDAGSLILNASGGNIVFTGNSQGAGANAVYINNSNGGASMSLNAASGNSITLFDPIQNNTAGGVIAVEKTGDGLVSFDGSGHGTAADRWSQLYAHTTVSGGTFEVANDAIYGALSTDAATPTAATSFTSAPGTQVQGGGTGTIRADSVTLGGDLSIAGRHPPAAGYSIFNISTNALALGGGSIRFNTYLNDGSTQKTDVLALDLHGSAISGQSLIAVTGTGGDGLPTSGNGIKLVDANGTGTTASAFALTNRLVSGAYEYFLFQGGNAAAGGDRNDQNWYLRNVYTPAATLENPTPRQVPIIRPEVPLSMAIAPLALEYGYAMLGTLHERGGEIWQNDTGPVTEERVVRCKNPARRFRCVVRVPVAAAQDGARWASSGWARLIGNRGIHDPNSFAKSGPDYSYTFGGIQAGLDIYARERQDGTLDKAGIYMGYGRITADVKGQPGMFYGGKAGSIDMDAFTLGGYWTHRSPQGWYTDAAVQGTWYSTEAKPVLGGTFRPDGFGILGSLEGGYAFRLGSGFTLEPSVQIVYQNVSFDRFHAEGAAVRFNDGNSLRGRLGLRLAKTWNRAENGREPRPITAWLHANVWHEFLGKTKTSWGAPDGRNMAPFNSRLNGTWGEIGAGVSAQVSKKVSLFASGSYQHSLDGKRSQGWNGRVGLTVRW